MQTAYSVGSPDLVIAGLTVVDPLVAVAIGIFVLGEASEMPVWALIVCGIAGAIGDLRCVPAGEAPPADHHRTAMSQGELSTAVTPQPLR